MKKILIKANNPAGNISLLEQQLSEEVRKYLSKEGKVCYVKPYEGFPMNLTEAKTQGDANYVLEIRVKECGKIK
jgi:hypothetical protein